MENVYFCKVQGWGILMSHLNSASGRSISRILSGTEVPGRSSL